MFHSIEKQVAKAFRAHILIRYGVDLPVCQQVDQVLNHGAAVRQVLAQLMGRDATVEI